MSWSGKGVHLAAHREVTSGQDDSRAVAGTWADPGVPSAVWDSSGVVESESLRQEAWYNRPGCRTLTVVSQSGQAC